MRFTKPALTYPQQLGKLRARGLVVADPAQAEHCLRYVGYYRLSAYGLSFQDCTQPGKPFRPGTTFEQVVDFTGLTVNCACWCSTPSSGWRWRCAAR